MTTSRNIARITRVSDAMRPLVIVGLAAAVAACSPAPLPTLSPATPSATPASTGQPTAAPSPSLQPSPAPAAWLPPWSGSGTPAAVVNRPPLPFCGVSEVGLGGPGDLAVRTCFAAALAAGREAEMAEIRHTIEGDPIATIFRSPPGGGVEILFDSTQDQFGVRAWTRQVCAGHDTDPQSQFFGTDCRDEPLGP